MKNKTRKKKLVTRKKKLISRKKKLISRKKKLISRKKKLVSRKKLISRKKKHATKKYKNFKKNKTYRRKYKRKNKQKNKQKRIKKYTNKIWGGAGAKKQFTKKALKERKKDRKNKARWKKAGEGIENIVAGAAGVGVGAVSGALSGAATGAAMGTFVNPGLGTLAGAASGATTGAAYGAISAATIGMGVGAAQPEVQNYFHQPEHEKLIEKIKNSTGDFISNKNNDYNKYYNFVHKENNFGRYENKKSVEKIYDKIKKMSKKDERIEYMKNKIDEILKHSAKGTDANKSFFEKHNPISIDSDEKKLRKKNKEKIEYIQDIMNEKINNIYIECETPSPPSEFSLNTLIKKIKKRAKEWGVQDMVINKETGIIKNFDDVFRDFIDFDNKEVNYEELAKIEIEKIEKLEKYLNNLKTSEQDGERKAVFYEMNSDEIDNEVNLAQKAFSKFKKGFNLLGKAAFGAASAGVGGVGMAAAAGYKGLERLTKIDKRYKCNEKILFMGKSMKVSEAIKRILEINLKTSKKRRGIKEKEKVKFKKFFDDEDSFINMCNVLEKKNVLKKGRATGRLFFTADEIVKGLAEIYKKKEDGEKKMKQEQKKRLTKFIEQRTDGDIDKYIETCKQMKRILYNNEEVKAEEVAKEKEAKQRGEKLLEIEIAESPPTETDEDKSQAQAEQKIDLTTVANKERDAKELIFDQKANE